MHMLSIGRAETTQAHSQIAPAVTAVALTAEAAQCRKAVIAALCR